MLRRGRYRLVRRLDPVVEGEVTTHAEVHDHRAAASLRRRRRRGPVPAVQHHGRNRRAHRRLHGDLMVRRRGAFHGGVEPGPVRADLLHGPPLIPPFALIFVGPRVRLRAGL